MLPYVVLTVRQSGAVNAPSLASGMSLLQIRHDKLRHRNVHRQWTPNR